VWGVAAVGFSSRSETSLISCKSYKTNLKDDIGEKKNLAASNREKMKTLSNLLDQWESEMSKTAAPFPTVVPKARPRKKEQK